jgi:hypothetical protein
VHAEDELAAPGSRVGHRDRGLDAELVSGTRLALGDALDLGRMEGVDLVLVLRFLGPHLGGKFQGAGEGVGQIGLALDLAADVALEPADPRAQPTQMPQRLLT